MDLQSNFSSTVNMFTLLGEIITACNKIPTTSLDLIPNVMVLFLHCQTNVNMLFLFVKNRKTLSSSEVLGLNLALLGVLFCLTLSLFFVLIYTGCPILLTSMCIEWYVAVSHPVLFISLGRSDFRAACSTSIWILTILMSTLTYIYTLPITAIYLSIIINVMFVIMVACLLGIICALRKRVQVMPSLVKKMISPKRENI